MHTQRQQHGFTLVEMVIAAGLLGFLAVTAIFFWVNGFTLVRTVNGDSAAIAEARVVLDRLAREIREVKYDSNASSYCVSTMTTAQFTFNKTSGTLATGCGGASPVGTYNDYAVNVQWAAANKNITLAYAGTLAAPALSSTLTSDASSFEVAYLQRDCATTAASAAELGCVQLTLTVQPSGVQATKARTVVALRNG
jgi:prepilin-type N-terminal cleavage/methylation domain-containing protein